MEGVGNKAFDNDQPNHVSTVIMFSLSGFTYVRTHWSQCLILFSFLIFSILKITHHKIECFNGGCDRMWKEVIAAYISGIPLFF
jgi:hypothetical protein